MIPESGDSAKDAETHEGREMAGDNEKTYNVTKSNEEETDEKDKRDDYLREEEYSDINDNNTDEQQQNPEIKEIKLILKDFQNACNTHIEKIGDAANVITTVTGDMQQDQRSAARIKRKRFVKEPGLMYNLIMLCMIIVLLMQIHMYILLYNKFNSMHQDVQEISCVIFGKNCPDMYTANQCLANKLDYMDNEQGKNLELLQRDVEELATVWNNVTKIVYGQRNVEDKESGNENEVVRLKKPLRTEAVYINP